MYLVLVLSYLLCWRKTELASLFVCSLKWHSDLFASGFAGFSEDFVSSSRWKLAECSKPQCSHTGESLQSSCCVWETRNAFITSVTPTLKLVRWNHCRLNCRELFSRQGPDSWPNQFLSSSISRVLWLESSENVGKGCNFFKYCVLLEK